MENLLYNYKIEIVSVIDGDTVDADIDLGFGVWARNQRFRLKGINCKEVKGVERAEGLKAKDMLERLLKGKYITAKTERDKTDKYGRYVAALMITVDPKRPETSEVVYVSEWMVKAGFAEKVDY